MKKLILVNRKDKIKSYSDEEKCHQAKGILHRAFAIFIFNDKNQLLIQKRSKLKKLWPGYWENSCSSHPFKGETYLKAGERRLKEELGFNYQLKFIDKFLYQASYKDIGSENEICTVLIGKYNKEPKPDPKEVADWKWINPKELKKEIAKNPQKYTPWVKIGLKKLMSLEKAEKKKQVSKLNALLNEYSKLIQPVIKKLLDFYVDEKNREIVKYQILTGGKRLRPALVIMVCQLLGGKIKDVLYPAAGLEILHNYSLIVDDIIDNSILRRGKPTAWAKFGKSIAQCIGIDYPAAAFQAANRSKEPIKISELFARTMKTIVDGEILDILFEQQGREDEFYVVKNRYQNITEKDYFEMVNKKTAALFQTCCEAGGICAGAKKKQIEALKNYGFNLGVAFQIQDDILDIFGEKVSTTKKIGRDIRERKGGNIIILFALKELSKKKKQRILKIMRKKEIKNKDIKEAVKLINQTRSRQKAYQFGQKFVEKAKKNLNSLSKNKWNDILREIAGFAIEREK